MRSRNNSVATSTGLGAIVKAERRTHVSVALQAPQHILPQRARVPQQTAVADDVEPSASTRQRRHDARRRRSIARVTARIAANDRQHHDVGLTITEFVDRTRGDRLAPGVAERTPQRGHLASRKCEGGDLVEAVSLAAQEAAEASDKRRFVSVARAAGRSSFLLVRMVDEKHVAGEAGYAPRCGRCRHGFAVLARKQLCDGGAGAVLHGELGKNAVEGAYPVHERDGDTQMRSSAPSYAVRARAATVADENEVLRPRPNAGHKIRFGDVGRVVDEHDGSTGIAEQVCARNETR
mmetsp:Transcript_21839/g.76635  ORF Transcript_21839/g.76635 Transcript_21839/m.76635 type:complete len:293 (+) Transcript_21839:60-938(+)